VQITFWCYFWPTLHYCTQGPWTSTGGTTIHFLYRTGKPKPPHHHHHRLYNSVRVLGSLNSHLQARLLLGFVTMIIFTVWGCQPYAQPPTWRTRVPLLVRVFTFDLSGKGDPASSYATAGIALRIIWPHKPHHYIRVGITLVWGGLLFIYFQITHIQFVITFTVLCKG
jgi:hypothetical protein